jgi:hypothetical protein
MTSHDPRRLVLEAFSGGALSNTKPDWTRVMLYQAAARSAGFRGPMQRHGGHHQGNSGYFT